MHFNAYLDSPNDNDFQAPDVVYIEFVVIYAPSLSHIEHYRWVMITIPHTTIDARPIMYINYVVTLHHIFFYNIYCCYVQNIYRRTRQRFFFYIFSYWFFIYHHHQRRRRRQHDIAIVMLMSDDGWNNEEKKEGMKIKNKKRNEELRNKI